MFDKLDEAFSKYKKAANNFKYDVKNELGDSTATSAPSKESSARTSR